MPACRACSAPIRFAVHTSTGKSHPVADPQAAPPSADEAGEVTSLLISEPPLQVLPSLAKAIGLNEAIVLQQLHYWTLRTKDPERWIFNSIEEWQEQFPFWSADTIKRNWKSLAAKGLVETSQQRGNDRTKSYRIVYSKIPRGQFASLDFAPLQQGKVPSCIGSTETTAENPPTPKGGEQVRDIFEFWQKALDKPQHQLTDKRRRKVLARLKEDGITSSKPYSPERVREIKEAIYGVRYSDHHMGRKPDSTRAFNDLELICRERGQIDTFRELFQTNRPKERGSVDVNAQRKELRKAQGLE